MPLQDNYSRMYHLIVSAHGSGLSQRNLLDMMELRSNQVSKIALKLERSGLVRREKSLEDGRWTYILKAVDAISLGPYESIPCVTCPYEDKCRSDGIISSRNCALETYQRGIAQWVLEEFDGEQKVTSMPKPVIEVAQKHTKKRKR
ncbi:MAG: MarR family transcriptional regulator [Thaumarchaeota archaeon]|nr:MarR family transcriptional regulator [Nitrososphaerota archaeon]